MTGGEDRTREVLNVVREIEKQICAERERLRKLQDAVENIVAETDGMPKGNESQSRVEILALVIVEARERIAALEKVKVLCADELQALLTDVLIEVSELQVMLLRYVDCLKFRDVALALRRSERWIYQLHENAIQNLENFFQIPIDFSSTL